MSKEIINILDYPELADKYINYELVSSIILAAVFIVGVIILGILYKVMDSELCGILCLICIALGIFIVPLQIVDIVKCITFPELQINDYIREITRGMS